MMNVKTRWILTTAVMGVLMTAMTPEALSTEDPLPAHLGNAVNAEETRAAWAAFVEYAIEYAKPYRTLANDHTLVRQRFQAFQLNLGRIAQHNALYAKGESTFELGLNALADLSDDEYKHMLGYKPRSASPSRVVATFKAPSDLGELPKSWDWREHDAVTQVKNQGQCGSCWAFSAVAAMECAYALTTGKLKSFSEQELVDCTRGGQDTCSMGGEMQDAFDEIIKNHKGKIDTEADYPYTAESKGICKAKDDKAVGHFTSYVNVTSGDETALQAAVATKGVQSVAIDASSFTFQLYRHGVYNWPLCGNAITSLDHGVAVAGYGVFKGKEFWLVKNSWSEGWGMKGYIMMTRNKNNQCGVATDASYPVMTKEEGQHEMMMNPLHLTQTASII